MNKYQSLSIREYRKLKVEKGYWEPYYSQIFKSNHTAYQVAYEYCKSINNYYLLSNYEIKDFNNLKDILLNFSGDDKLEFLFYGFYIAIYGFIFEEKILNKYGLEHNIYWDSKYAVDGYTYINGEYKVFQIKNKDISYISQEDKSMILKKFKLFKKEVSEQVEFYLIDKSEKIFRLNI